MARKKQLIRQVGVTTEGKPVVAGIYRFCETVGLPLVDALFVLDQQGQVPCWESYYKEALDAGMKHARILSRLKEAMADTYSPEFLGVVIERLDDVETASQ